MAEGTGTIDRGKGQGEICGGHVFSGRISSAVRSAGTYEPLAEGDGAALPGAAAGSLVEGVGEPVGVADAVPLFAGVTARTGIGIVGGTAGADVSGWMGIGIVFGAFCTGVAFNTGVAHGDCVTMGTEDAGAGDSGGGISGGGDADTGDSGALPQAQRNAARINTKILFMIMPPVGKITNRIFATVSNYFGERP